MSDYAMAKQSKWEEDKAVADYISRREKSKDPELKQAFTHAIGEEKDHSRRFYRAMKKQYSENEVKEAKRMRGGEE